METRKKIAWGSFLATLGALGMVLSPLLGWSATPRPWGFLLGFALGVSAGLGTALSLAGMIEHKRGMARG
ncbi:MAG: hypothetical protein PHV11_09705 [Candidatus Bipolaricaulis sp.]|nr:hypothetical protein [Candidatus Bipolaricaulis sp.]MDD5220830.1 hypothetical protein [Candidatus Bipolaricaulis sp.]MDD5645679.1 hypothetical protein [Candidatus Bipolaricaulis sp.]